MCSRLKYQHVIYWYNNTGLFSIPAELWELNKLDSIHSTSANARFIASSTMFILPTFIKPFLSNPLLNLNKNKMILKFLFPICLPCVACPDLLCTWSLGSIFSWACSINPVKWEKLHRSKRVTWKGIHSSLMYPTKKFFAKCFFLFRFFSYIPQANDSMPNFLLLLLRTSVCSHTN